MKRFSALLLALVMLFSLCGCHRRDAVLSESWTYAAEGEITSLNIRIGAADFRLRAGDAFAVESNLKYLSVSEQGGTLVLDEDTKPNSNYKDAFLYLTVPRGAQLDRVDIKTGAAEISVDALDCKTLDMKLGAGDVSFAYLAVSAEADIEGGAGKITVSDGSIRDLDLEMGVGELDLTVALLGDCDLEFGVGESKIALLGDKDRYCIEIDKGIGPVFVDGVKVTDFGTSGSGENHIEISGGLGEIRLTLEEE